jgi:hypothetical protein
MSDRPRGDQAGAAEGERQTQQEEDHRRAVERLLWTPTEGQDLTKSYFPLSENSDDSSD